MVRSFRTPKGSICPAPKQVREHAIVIAGKLIRNKTELHGSEWRMNVTDENGRPVFTFRFAADDQGSAP
jgi:hypothetical protein